MRSRQVPRAEWYRFFRDFSRRHQGKPLSVRVIHPRMGSQLEARDLALEGVVADSEGLGPISIHLGQEATDHVEHDIRNPTQVWVEMNDDGAEEALSIEASDGTKTILELASPRPTAGAGGARGR